MDNVRDILVNYRNSLVSSGVWNPKIMKCYDLQYPSMTVERNIFTRKKDLGEGRSPLRSKKLRKELPWAVRKWRLTLFPACPNPWGAIWGAQKLSNCPMPGPQEPHDLDTKGLTPGFVGLFLIFYRRIPKVTSSQFTMAPWLQTVALLTADMKNKIAPETFDSRFS